jgi:hypothetical protein
MGRGKKERANRGASGGANYAWVAAALVGVLAVGFVLSGFWGTRGCTDVSALNYAPAATADDGTCVGSMYDLSGVFEFQTTAAAAPKQLEAIGIEFDAVDTRGHHGGGDGGALRTLLAARSGGGAAAGPRAQSAV